MCQCAPPASRSCLSSTPIHPRTRPFPPLRIPMVSLSLPVSFPAACVRACACFCGIYLFCSARAAGLFDNRSASILIQTATKTIPTTRRSRKITPIAVPSTVPEKCTVLVVLSGNVFLKIPGANYHHLPFISNSCIANLLP